MNTAKLKDPDTIRRFLLAGNARVTLVSSETGTRYTYRIKRAKGKDLAFAGLLTGPDNFADYKYFANIWAVDDPARTEAKHGRKARISEDSPGARAFYWFFRNLSKGYVSSRVEVWHEGKCGRCGRDLTVPESIASGLGPVCAAKMGL